ncbi:MFS transporter [Cohnella lupini]|uniref:MFS transporter n=1 Tax=Cohnella lupini TaxID=1294267 RepID=A0A3D9IQJ2_9BACL|nr:MFS transporter [Cohnella lupini]RED64012.1 MFS transporter [Cohnella lupini]
MSKEMRKLLVMNAISSIITIYIGIFVNLYIWEDGQSIAEVSLYNMSMFITWGIAFVAAAKLLNRFTIRLPLAVSAICGAAAFTYLVSVQIDNRMLWIILLGIPVGAMFGSAGAAQNLSIALRGKGSEFAPYFAAFMVISQILSMVVPFVSAKVIDGFGYAGSFVMMLVFVALMLAFSFVMPKITLAEPLRSGKPAVAVRYRFRSAFGRPGSKWIILSLLAAGVFMQFQNLFTLLFTFSVTQDKLLIALLNMLYTCCSLLGLWMYRKIKINEMRWLWIGMSLMAVGFLIVLFKEPIALILSNVLTSIGMFYFTTVWNAQQFRFIQHAEPSQQASFLVWRECTLVFTRCVLLALTLPLKDMGGSGFALIIGVTIVCLLSIPAFQQRAMREAEGERKS